jgi:FG-GAP repeat
MKTLFRISVFASIAVLSALTASGSTPVALTGSDNPGFSFGYGVTINRYTAAVSGNGAIYVFVKPAGGWTSMTQTAKLTASDGASLYSVAISGNTIVAGSYLNSEAFVFVAPAGGWTDMTETAKLTASDGFSGDFFGSSVAISSNTVVVGAAQTNSIGARLPSVAAGSAYVYVRPAGGWLSTTETAKLVASDRVAGDALGESVGIQGNTIVAGAPNARIGGNTFQGAVYVFVKRGLSWVSTTETAKLTNPYIPYIDTLGFSVSISNNTIAAAGFELAFVYVKPSAGWMTTSTPTAQLTESPAHPNFGQSIAICKNVVVVGAPGNVPGVVSAADVYDQPLTGWKNMSQNFSVHSPVDGGHGSFGWSVGVSGYTVIVGYPQIFGFGTFGEVAYVYSGH